MTIAAASSLLLIASACGTDQLAPSADVATELPVISPPTITVPVDDVISTNQPDTTDSSPSPSQTAPPAQPLNAIPTAVSLGAGVTDFTLPTGLGDEINLTEVVGDSNVLLVFYRAWW
jgi:hypothetical protein